MDATQETTALGLMAPASRQRPMRPSAGGESDLDSCSRSIRNGSKSFHLASMILPRPTRQAAHALYAFCRHSDDLIDDPRAGHDALARLRQRLDLIYAGTPANHACDRAFAGTVRAHAIPKMVPEALLDGFAMDLDGRRFRTIADLKSYATCVASTVGVMMAMVMGAGDPRALSRAADLGIAMQLTNIARDVGEDARNGRLYLPLDWMAEAGLDPDAFLRSPRFSPALAALVQRLLAEADHHYRLGHAGIVALPANCRHAIRTAALVYQEIGAQIAANGHDSVTRRAHTAVSTKLALMLRARLARPQRRGQALTDLNAQPDAAAAALVEAASRAFAHAGYPTVIGASPAGTSVDRVVSILMRLQSGAAEDGRVRRLAAREKAAALV